MVLKKALAKVTKPVSGKERWLSLAANVKFFFFWRGGGGRVECSCLLSVYYSLDIFPVYIISFNLHDSPVW